MLLNRNLTWRFMEGTSTPPTCVLEGIIGEDAGLEELIPEIKGPVRFDMIGISRVNSTGVREWLKFIDSIDPKGPHQLARCSVSVVAQLNMIDNFKASAQVESVMAPYFCESCEAEATREVPIEGTTPKMPKISCPECDEPMSFDELEDRYFYFLSF